jgi:hypothetical protein
MNFIYLKRSYSQTIINMATVDLTAYLVVFSFTLGAICSLLGTLLFTVNNGNKTVTVTEITTTTTNKTKDVEDEENEEVEDVESEEKENEEKENEEKENEEKENEEKENEEKENEYEESEVDEKQVEKKTEVKEDVKESKYDHEDDYLNDLRIKREAKQKMKTKLMELFDTFDEFVDECPVNELKYAYVIAKLCYGETKTFQVPLNETSDEDDDKMPELVDLTPKQNKQDEKKIEEMKSPLKQTVTEFVVNEMKGEPTTSQINEGTSQLRFNL